MYRGYKGTAESKSPHPFRKDLPSFGVVRKDPSLSLHQKNRGGWAKQKKREREGGGGRKSFIITTRQLHAHTQTHTPPSLSL